MTAVWTLAGLTIREAVRRRVFIAALLIALLFAAFAFLPITVKTGPFMGMDMEEARNNTGRLLAWQGCGVMKFFASILAVTLSAGAITAEVDKGVLSVVVPKPLPRAAVYLGKWLGLILMLLASIALWSVLLAWAVWMHTHTFHPRIFVGALSVCLFPLLFVTLTLFFSSFATYSLSAGLALIAAGMALAEDILRRLSSPFVLNAPILNTLADIVSYIVPLNRMNHWITRGLGNAGWDISVFFGQGGPGAPPASVATGAGDMAYILAYMAFFLAAGLIVFQRRDL